MAADDSVVVRAVGGHVAEIEFGRPPDNYFDVRLIRQLVDTYNELGETTWCRAIVLVSSGRHFCAGADFKDDLDGGVGGGGLAALYDAAVDLFASPLPVVAGVQGAAIGGGLGLAMSADFRIAAEGARFAANFAQLGIHHGFGLSETLPSAIGQQHALDLLMTGRRIRAEEALRLGVCDAVVPDHELRATAAELATALAASAPLALRSIRATLRADIVERVRRATAHELHEQLWLRGTDDFDEGVRASAERRPPKFLGR